MRTGFVSIIGRPNAGKSTLLNALVGEKMAIISPKAQTTRHRIRAFLNGPDHQVIFSDTPGIITPEYRLHEKMMGSFRASLEDADLLLLLVDAQRDPEEAHSLFSSLKLKERPAILVLNKCDRLNAEQIRQRSDFFEKQPYVTQVLAVSAAAKTNIDALVSCIIQHLPEGEPYFNPEDLTDMPVRFFVSELIREQIFASLEQEIPYHSTVLLTGYKELPHLTRISADIIVQRESQKAILLGEKGAMIRHLGTEARKSIESFLGQKVYLELFVKVRPKWRDNDLYLKEYGYI